MCRHLHEDEEIRAILEGTGYFDIRGNEENTSKLCTVTLNHQAD